MCSAVFCSGSVGASWDQFCPAQDRLLSLFTEAAPAVHRCQKIAIYTQATSEITGVEYNDYN